MRVQTNNKKWSLHRACMLAHAGPVCGVRFVLVWMMGGSSILLRFLVGCLCVTGARVIGLGSGALHKLRASIVPSASMNEHVHPMLC